MEKTLFGGRGKENRDLLFTGLNIWFRWVFLMKDKHNQSRPKRNREYYMEGEL